MSQETVSSLLTRIQKITQSQNKAKRYTLYPIADDEAYKYYKKQEAAIWNANELEFVTDKNHYNMLPDNQKHIIKIIYAYFASADGIIVQNLVFRFLVDCENFEETAFYITQLYIELVHSDVYSLTINTLIDDPEERARLFNAIDEMDCVKRKAEWMEKYMCADLPISYRRLAFACAEGIFFQSPFLGIFWFRTRGVLPNVIFTNEQVSKDEGLHTDFALNRLRRDKALGREMPSPEFAYKMISEAVEIEKEFLDSFLPEAIDDFTPEYGERFIELIGNYLSVDAGYEPMYDVQVEDLPSWIQEIANQQKGNFYEVRIGNYKQSSLKSAVDWKSRTEAKENKASGYDDPLSVSF